MEAGKRTRAIPPLLAKTKLSRKSIKTMLNNRSDVVWKKELHDSHWQNCAYVTEETLAELLSRHAPAEAEKQPKLAFKESSAATASCTNVQQLLKNLSEAKRQLADQVAHDVERLSVPAKQLDIAEVLRSEDLTKLNESQVGAKAAQIWRARFPGREMGMRSHTLPGGRIVQVRNWTHDEREFLRLAALSIAASSAGL